MKRIASFALAMGLMAGCEPAATTPATPPAAITPAEPIGTAAKENDAATEKAAAEKAAATAPATPPAEEAKPNP